MIHILIVLSQFLWAEDPYFFSPSHQPIKAEGIFENCVLSSNGGVVSFRLDRTAATGAYYRAELGAYQATIHHNFNRHFEQNGPSTCGRNQFLVEIHGSEESIVLTEDDLDLNLSMALRSAPTESVVFSTVLSFTRGFLGELKTKSGPPVKVICSMGV